MLTLTIPSRGAYKLGDNTEDHPGFGVYISTCIEPRRLKSEVHGVDGRDDIDREDGPLEMVVIGRHVSPNFSPQSSPSVQSRVQVLHLPQLHTSRLAGSLVTSLSETRNGPITTYSH